MERSTPAHSSVVYDDAGADAVSGRSYMACLHAQFVAHTHTSTHTHARAVAVCLLLEGI